MARPMTACDVRGAADAAVHDTVIPLDHARRRRAPPSRRTARVLLLGGQALERAGLRRLLEDEAGLCVVGEAPHDADAVALAAATAPDVIVVDGRDWSRGHEPRPATAAVLLLTDVPGGELHAALRHGVTGVLAKSSRPEQLVAAVRTLAAGGPLVPRGAVRRLIAAHAAGAPLPA